MTAMALSRLIIGHEIRILLRTPAFGWMMIGLVIVLLFAAWSGANAVNRQKRGLAVATAYAERMKEEYRNGTAESLGEGRIMSTNPGVVGHGLNAYAILPETGLSAMSVGQSDLKLNYIPVNMDGIYNTSNSFSILKDGEMENPVNLKKGPFDLAFVIVFLLPILVITVSYDLLSSEKERGTLAMVLAQPISLQRLTASKLFSRFTVLLVVVLFINVIALVAIGSDLAALDTWIRFAIWLAAAMLYGLFWFALAVLINAYGRSSPSNGMALAGIWLGLVVVIPTLISLLATTLYPAPSRMDFIAQQRAAQEQTGDLVSNALDQYAFDHPEFVPNAAALMDNYVAVREARSERIEKALRPLHDRFQSQLARQEETVSRFQFFSPAIMMQRILNEVAGSSTERFADFAVQVSVFQKEWKEFFARRIIAKQTLGPADFDRFPQFRYENESIRTMNDRLLPSIIPLLILVGIVTGTAFWTLRRYQIAG